SGAETMKSRPRRRAASIGLLDILDLLAHLLELGFGVDDQLRDAHAVGLRADGVAFAIYFLEQEVEFAAARFIGLGERLPVREVRAKPRDFLADVRPGRGTDDFL